MTHPIANDPVQVVPSDQKKRHGKWIAAGAVVLAAAGLGLYKYGGKVAEKISPLDPAPARQQVPVDKAVEHKPTQAAAPAPVSTVDVAPAAPVAPDKSESSIVLSRLSNIEQALDQQGKAIDKLSSDIAELVSSQQKPIVPVASEQPRPQKRRNKALVRKQVKDLAESKITQPKDTAPELLSVDTWNGRPSVAVRNGAAVQFLAEGDRAGAYTLHRAEQGSQRATFADPAGAVVVKERTER